jgi:hypothetical protein
MGRLDVPMTDSDIATKDAINLEYLKRRACTNNVDDCINAADFVELNIIHGNPVNVCFNLCEYSEYLECSFTNTGGKFGIDQELFDVAPGAVVMVIVMMMHTNDGSGGADSGTLSAFKHQRVVIKRKTAKYFDDLQRIGASINERCQSHVTGSASTTMKPSSGAHTCFACV